MDTDTPKQPNKAIIAIVVIVLLAVVTTAVVFMGKKAPETKADTASTTAPSSSSTTSTTPSNATFKDGNYEATSTYQSPGGTEKVDLKVTLAGGVITDTSLTTQPSSSTAEQYQGMFIGGYKAQVVGKKIGDVLLSRVAGSSLTSGGFNSALETIKSNAKA